MTSGPNFIEQIKHGFEGNMEVCPKVHVLFVLLYRFYGFKKTHL